MLVVIPRYLWGTAPRSTAPACRNSVGFPRLPLGGEKERNGEGRGKTAGVDGWRGRGWGVFARALATRRPPSISTRPPPEFSLQR